MRGRGGNKKMLLLYALLAVSALLALLTGTDRGSRVMELMERKQAAEAKQ